MFSIPAFNERVVREAVLNAVCHRCYQNPGSVFVRQYPNRMVIESPGGLPHGITLDNILYRQSPRNRRLAEILSRCGLVERSGQGMNLIYEFCIKEAKALPDFTGTDDYFVRITLNGLLTNKNILPMMQTIGEEVLAGFSTEDFLIVDLLFKGCALPRNLTAPLGRLIELGVVEKNGRRHVLARRLYASAGKPGAYTRHAGLDRGTNKALILKHICDSSYEGSPLCDLQDVLPALNKNQIQDLLRELAREGCIHVEGRTRAARWYKGAKKCDESKL